MIPIANKPTGITHAASLWRIYSNGVSSILIFEILIINPINIANIIGLNIKFLKNWNNLILFLTVNSKKKLTMDNKTTLSIKIIPDIWVIVLPEKKISAIGKTNITWLDKATVRAQIIDSWTDLLKVFLVNKKANIPLVNCIKKYDEIWDTSISPTSLCATSFMIKAGTAI